jgi:hypothetical protein
MDHMESRWTFISVQALSHPQSTRHKAAKWEARMTWARLHEVEEAVKLVKADWKMSHGNLTEDIRDRIGKIALKVAVKDEAAKAPELASAILVRLAH